MSGNSFRLLVLVELADTRSDHCCTDDSTDAADHVYRAGAREIVETELHQPAAAPYPVRFYRVYHKADNARINAVRQELRALCHCAGNDSCRSRAEHEIEHEGRPVEMRVVGEYAEGGHSAEPAQHVLAHHKTEAEKCEHDCADAEVHEVLHDDVARVFRTGKTCFDHCEARLHKEHEGCADQVPNTEYFGINCFHDVVSIHKINSFHYAKGHGGSPSSPIACKIPHIYFSLFISRQTADRRISPSIPQPSAFPPCLCTCGVPPLRE